MAILREGKPNRICLHHAAVNGIPANIEELKKRLTGYEITHSKKSWASKIKTPGEFGYNYIEYHRAIAGNGHEITLQDDKYVLYHAGDNARGKDSFNLHGIAVLIDGNYMTDQPNDLQLEAFARIIARFEKKYGVDVIVRGHKETSLTGTSCPGTNLGDSKQGFLRKAIDRANVIVKQNLPTNPIQEDTPVTPPEPPQDTECEKRIKRLEGELEARETTVKTLTSELGAVVEDRNRIEGQYTEVVRELNEIKKVHLHWVYQIADVLYNLFNKK